MRQVTEMEVGITRAEQLTLLRPRHDLLDVLAARTRRDEERIGRVDDDDIVDSEASDLQGDAASALHACA